MITVLTQEHDECEFHTIHLKIKNFNRMKKIFLYFSLLLTIVALWMTSCQNEMDLVLSEHHFISIAELREMYNGERLMLANKEKGKEILIGGVVISNPDNKNNPDGKIILQNYADGQLRGIALAMEEHLDRYKEGDSVVVKLDGCVLERVDGILQLSDLTVLEVGRISTGNEQKVHITTDNFESVLADRDTYESTLVSFHSVDVLDVERGQTFGDKDLELSDGSSTIFIKTKKTANLAAAEVPIEGNFTGIILYTDSQEPYLSLRSSADFDGRFMPPENYFGFPEGWENIVGTRKTNANTDGYDEYPSGRWFINRGMSNSSANIVNKMGDWAMMLQSGAPGSAIAMDFDLLFGASKFSFYYAAATKGAGDSAPITVYPEYSQDSGETWILLGSELLVNDQNIQYFKEYDLDIAGKVRFRVRKAESTSRLIVDDIFIKPNRE